MANLGYFVSVEASKLAPEHTDKLQRAGRLEAVSNPGQDDLLYIRCRDISHAVIESEGFRLRGVKADFLKGELTAEGMKELPLNQTESNSASFWLYEATDYLTDPWYGY